MPNDYGDSIIIINGDVLTKVNFKEVLKYHKINSADITICAREHIISSPFGVIEVDDIYFKSIKEKPSFKHLVNAGIYVLNSQIIKSIQSNQYLDMPDLISFSKSQSKRIIVYPIHEYWLDIGKPESLDKALYEWKKIIKD